MILSVDKLIERGIERGLDKEIIKEAIQLNESIRFRDLVDVLTDDVKRQKVLDSIKTGNLYAVAKGGVTYKGEPIDKDKVINAIRKRIQLPIDDKALGTIINFYYQ